MLTAPHFETCLKLSGEAWEFEKREYKQTVTNPRSFQMVQECYMPVQGRLMRERRHVGFDILSTRVSKQVKFDKIDTLTWVSKRVVPCQTYVIFLKKKMFDRNGGESFCYDFNIF